MRPGTLAWYNVLHETGHAMGLKHPQDVYSSPSGHPKFPAAYDSMEYTVMSYDSYVGDPDAGAGGNATYDYPQTYMMYDIAALQNMYGADFTTNSGNTTYSWRPGDANTYVNGQIAIDPAGSTIFATIWDGGGIDTYDCSTFSTGVTLDLRPSSGSFFDYNMLANLGDGKTASANIYNAFLFNGDARSYIENATGGAGEDVLIGNNAANVLRGNAGRDQMNGLGGNDTYIGGAAEDTFYFYNRGDGRDTITDWNDAGGDVIYLTGSTTLTNISTVLSRMVQVGADVELRDTDGDVLVIKNATKANFTAEDFFF